MSRGYIRLALTALVVLGVLLRVVMTIRQPFTSDEGAYLYDAATLLEGRLPAGDVLTKSPVMALVLMGSVLATRHALLAGRLVSMASNLLTTIPLGMLATSLRGKRAGRWTRILWLLGAGPIIYAAFGQTESLAVLLGTTVLALAARASFPVPRDSDEAERVAASPAARHWILVGITYGLALATRKSTSVLLLPLLIIFISSRAGPRRQLGRRGGAFLLGVTIVLLPWMVAVAVLYGTVGVSEALGAGYFSIIMQRLSSPSEVPSWAGPWVTPLRIALQLLGPLALIAFFSVISPAGASPRAANLLRRCALSWLFAVLTAYLVWPTVLPDYFPELIAPLTLLAAEGGMTLTRLRPFSIALIAAMLLTWNVAAFARVYRQPWIGLYTASAVREAAAELSARVPQREPVLTAALLVPYLSGHQVLFDIAHPYWYRYPFIPERVKYTFLPPLTRVEQAVRAEVNWVLVDQFTDYAYLRHSSNLLDFVWRSFSFVKKIPNDTGARHNPLLLWRRP